MLRARALEQALRMLIDAAVQTACKIAEDGDRRWHVVDLVCATNDAEKLLAVDPPPSGASPQAEMGANVRALTVHICEDCLNLRGEMCNEPGCRFCRRTMAEVADYLDVLLIRPRIDGVSVLVDEGAPLPAPVSPVEPEPPQTVRKIALEAIQEMRRTGESHEMCARWISERVARIPKPTVEPEPATTCRCLDCEPLTDPGPKPSEDDINRLEKAAWDSKTDLVLVWYRDRAEMFRQRLRETERAWQLDRKKPTVEPEPCPTCGEGRDKDGTLRCPEATRGRCPLKKQLPESPAPPAESPAPSKPVVNLMDALRRSLESLDRSAPLKVER